MRKKGLSGFKYAQEGILHCFRTQPHMRYHFYILVGVLLSGLMLNLNNRDMLVLVFSITLVIVAEMFNTAIEVVVNMVTENYNPAAKLAKDVAAGAVVMAAMNAVIAGVLIFFGQARLDEIQRGFQQEIRPDITKVVVIGIVLLTLIVIISKLLSDTGSPWHGGIISGHSAIGFLLAMIIFFTGHNPVATFLAILLAVLVAQSRVEAGIHTVQEVVLGAVLAILLTSLVFWVMPKVRLLMNRHTAPRAAAPVPPRSLAERRQAMPPRFEGVVCLADSSRRRSDLY